jgi:alcohol dehydrogenase (cytochrome c)
MPARNPRLGFRLGGLASALLAATVLGGAPTANAADVTQQRLVNSDREPQNWLHALGNSRNLKVAFAVGIGGTGGPQGTIDIQGSPIVDDGMMYVSDGFGSVYKIDVRNPRQGLILWTADSGLDRTANASPRNRGLAVWGNTVVNNLLDGRLITVNRDTGEIVLDKQVAGRNEFDIAEQFTAAPLVVDGKAIVGQSRGDAGTRGWIASIDLRDGKELWRTYMVPGPGEPGHETWKDGHNAWKTGGGALWTTGSYDDAQKLTIWGTGNPVPMFDPEFRPGDNLYTDSVVALDVGDGKMKWYFQYTPNESWDFDEQGVHMLYDTTIGNETRKVVGHFARNGFFYQVDRTNGAFVVGKQFVEELNWTKGLDPKTGKPVEYDPSKALQSYVPAVRAVRGGPAVQVCPTHRGGLRWQPPALNPEKGLVYGAGAEGCTELRVTPLTPAGTEPTTRGKNLTSGGQRTVPKYYGSIKAVDVKTGEVKAKTVLKFENKSGVLATSGGLIASGTQDGFFAVYNDETLEELWSFNMGTQPKAPPIAYSVNGKQFLAIMTGGSPDADGPQEMKRMYQIPMVWVFSL